jgi:hypothetical protein
MSARGSPVSACPLPDAFRGIGRRAGDARSEGCFLSSRIAATARLSAAIGDGRRRPARPDRRPPRSAATTG